MMMNKQHQSSTLEITIAAVIIASMLALSVVVLVTQEADAATASKKFSFKQTQVNKCSDSAKCSHTATIIFRLPGGNDHGPKH
jgi:uncharacterized membrane protein